jgi:predicted unusual protein kinase regulating ubiquinone biosynthesis (AarF/ABC1/UbiB family)
MLTMEYSRASRTRCPSLADAGRAHHDDLGGALNQMIFQDGFFHADLHPGNLIISRCLWAS